MTCCSFNICFDDPNQMHKVFSEIYPRQAVTVWVSTSGQPALDQTIYPFPWVMSDLDCLSSLQCGSFHKRNPDKCCLLLRHGERKSWPNGSSQVNADIGDSDGLGWPPWTVRSTAFPDYAVVGNEYTIQTQHIRRLLSVQHRSYPTVLR